MSKDITIRKATEEDAPVIVRFNLAMARETEDKDLPFDVVTRGVKRVFSDTGRGFYLVAESGREVVACLLITSEWSDWRNGSFWWIQSVYVRPDMRRRGIYSQLYRWVKDSAAKAEDVCGFRLYVEKDNLNARRSYESLGMSETNYIVLEELKSIAER